jgi:ribonuclease P protein component
MIGRLNRPADFERLLATPASQRSAHFAIHHLNGHPLPPPRSAGVAEAAELSTGCGPICPKPVDDGAEGHWLGCIVPKRCARRAVTRNTIERQIRAAAERHESELPHGLWLVRLRRPFDAKAFLSADSEALREAAKTELEQLFTLRLVPARPAATQAGVR